MAGMMPEDDWHHLTPRTGSPRYWPLFTLWADSNNWIEFGAVCEGDQSNDTAKGRFRIRISAQGTVTTFDWPRDTNGDLVEDVYWSRNSQLLVALAYAPPVAPAINGSLSVVASLGGEEPRNNVNAPLAITLPTSATFDTIRFLGAGDEVVAFRWFGAKAVAGTAMSFADMNDQFRSLDFLVPS
jgi:hypothetical protein